MPMVREMNYDVTDKDNVKIVHRTRWWSWVRFWNFISRAKKVENTPGFEAWVKVKKKK